MVVNFMLIFYIDVFGFIVVVVGILLLVVCLFDGIIDFVMGIIVDRIRVRLGGYCLYFLYFVVFFGVFVVFVFYILDWFFNGKFIYVYVIYGLLMMIYIVINIFYGVLGGMMIIDFIECVFL